MPFSFRFGILSSSDAEEKEGDSMKLSLLVSRHYLELRMDGVRKT
jgi:hypothetical protein